MIKLKSVKIESEDYISRKTVVLKDLFTYFQENPTFSEPTLLISKHTNISKIFQMDLLTNPESDIFLVARWIILQKSHDCKIKTFPDIQLDRYYSNQMVSCTYDNEHETRETEYETKIVIHDHKLIKHLIIGIEPHLYNKKLIFHFFSNWDHEMSLFHLYFLSKIQNFFNEIIISFSHQHIRRDSPISEKIIRHVLDHTKLTILHHVNNKKIAEAVSFYHLLERINPGYDDYIFYGHSKGLRHDNYEAVLNWVTILYYKNISHFDEMIYSKAVMAGCFISRMAFDLTNRNPWHYSGSFYWFSPKHERQHKLASILQNQQYDYYITEKFPGRLCPLKENCIDFCQIRIGPYSNCCPLYHINFYDENFPQFISIVLWIRTKIDFELLNRIPS